jgi:hypothetical protein
MPIPEDPLTAEAIRYLFTYTDAREVLEGLRAAVAEHRALVEAANTIINSIEATARFASDGAADIRAAVAEARDEANYENLVKSVGESVHFNGYAALENLVQTSQQAAIDDMRALMQHAGSTVELSIKNFQEAVIGMPPLPAASPHSGIFTRASVGVLSAWIRFRRFCIASLPIFALATVVFLGILICLVATRSSITH